MRDAYAEVPIFELLHKSIEALRAAYKWDQEFRHAVPFISEVSLDIFAKSITVFTN